MTTAPRPTTTLTLTTGTDTLIATSDHNKFVATDQTLNPQDTLMGFGDDNTLNLTIGAGATTGSAHILDIQTGIVTANGDVTLDTRSWLGLKTLDLGDTQSASTANVVLTGTNNGTGAAPTVNIDPNGGLDRLILTSDSFTTVNAAHATALQVVDASQVKGDFLINISATNIAVTGPAQGGTHIITDHAPTGFLQANPLFSNSLTINILNPAGFRLDSLSAAGGNISHFQAIQINGPLVVDGGTLDLSTFDNTLHQVGLKVTDTGPQGITINAGPIERDLVLYSSVGAPIAYNSPNPFLHLEGDIQNAVTINGTEGTVRVESVNSDHLRLVADTASEIDFSGNGSLDLSGSSWSQQTTTLDASKFVGTLSIILNPLAEADFVVGHGTDIVTGNGGAFFLDFKSTGVQMTNTNIGAALDKGSMADDLAAAMQGGKGHMSWFQAGGNTFVVEDITGGASFTQGKDVLVELTGLHNLTNSSFFDSHITVV